MKNIDYYHRVGDKFTLRNKPDYKYETPIKVPQYEHKKGVNIIRVIIVPFSLLL